MDCLFADSFTSQFLSCICDLYFLSSEKIEVVSCVLRLKGIDIMSSRRIIEKLKLIYNSYVPAIDVDSSALFSTALQEAFQVLKHVTYLP